MGYVFFPKKSPKMLNDLKKAFNCANSIKKKKEVEDNIKISLFYFFNIILIGEQYRRLVWHDHLKLILNSDI